MSEAESDYGWGINECCEKCGKEVFESRIKFIGDKGYCSKCFYKIKSRKIYPNIYLCKNGGTA